MLGSDLSGVLDIDFALSTVSGRTALGQAILRRLTTPRGGLVGDPTYGYAVFETIGSTVPTSVIEQRVLEQVLAEEEVEDARVSVQRTGESLRIVISVVDAEGPFELTLTRDQLTTEALLGDRVIFSEAA